MTRSWPANLRTLLVEDDRLTGNLLKTRLEWEGMKVRVAMNGLEALAMLQEEPADLVITDLMMPAMNGFQLIQEIRRLPQPIAAVPIMVISTNQNQQEMVSCFSAGADDFMPKPILIPLMMERLWRLVQRGHPME